jgi:hypothetical protein
LEIGHKLAAIGTRRRQLGTRPDCCCSLFKEEIL